MTPCFMHETMPPGSFKKEDRRESRTARPLHPRFRERTAEDILPQRCGSLNTGFTTNPTQRNQSPHEGITLRSLETTQKTMDVTAITPQRLLHKAGLVQDVLRAMSLPRNLCGAELCLAIRQQAKPTDPPQSNVLRPQDATLENPVKRPFKNRKTSTERDALKCATFLLSVFHHHPSLRNVCAEQLPTAILNLWIEADHTSQRPLTATAPSPLQHASSPQETTAEDGAKTTSCLNAENVEQTENEKAFPLKPLFPKEKEKKENPLSSTLPDSHPTPEANGERDSHSLSEPTALTELPDSLTESDTELDTPAENPTKPSKAKRRKKEKAKENYMEWTYDDFCRTAHAQRKLLTDEEYELFVAYWTERDKNGKMKFQFCKTFSFERRMRTWMNKSKQIKQEEERRLTAKYGQPASTDVPTPPTEEEVVNYATQRNIDATEARTFFFYYQAHSWKMRGQAITDWKAALALWMQRKSTRRRNENTNPNPNTNSNTDGQKNSTRGFGRTSKAEANAEVDNFAKRLIDNERNKNTNPDNDFLSLMGDDDNPVFA